MRVMGVSEAKPDREIFLLMLEEIGGERRMPVIIGGFEARSILVGLHEARLKRPIIYDLMVDMMNRCDIRPVEVDVVRKSGEVYYSTLIVKRAGGEEVTLECRTSDAVALAVRRNIPIFVDETILDEVKDRVQVRHTYEAPANMLFDDELKDMLAQAVQREDYEKAKALKDEIRRRGLE